MNRTRITIILSFLLLGSLASLSAQDVSDRVLRPFSSIDVSQGIVLHLSEGAEQKVTVKIPEDLQSAVITNSSDGVLRLGVNDKYRENEFEKIIVYIDITIPKLSALNAAGNSTVLGLTSFVADDLSLTVSSGSLVRFDKSIKANKLSVNVSANGKLISKAKSTATAVKITSASNGEVSLNIDVEKDIDCGATSKGKITLSGKAPEALIAATSHSDIRMKAFEANRVNAVATTSASIGITAKNFLAATATYGATISYWGKPKSLSKEATSGGKIK